jgi:hypothetical protein
MSEKEPVKDAKDAVVVPQRSRVWVFGIVAAVIGLYAVIVIAGLWFMQAVTNRSVGMYGINGHTAMMGRGGNGFDQSTGEQTFKQTATTSDGLTSTSTTTTFTKTQGVVTAINPDSIVVAGGGKMQTIKTTSATTYANDTKPVVNDSVVIIGKKDGDTLTATQIYIYN